MRWKHVWMGLFVFAVVVALAVMGWQVATLRWDCKWNTWVNRISIATQPGSTEKQVVQMLGVPAETYKAKDVLGKFTPDTLSMPWADEVYVYGGFFPLHEGFWTAYIFLDAGGRVVGVYMKHS